MQAYTFKCRMMLCAYTEKHEHFSLQTFTEVPQRSFNYEELCFPILLKPGYHKKSLKFLQLHCTGKEKTAAHAFVRDVMFLHLTHGETKVW